MKTIQADEFIRLMETVAKAWSDGQMERAAEYYTERALFEFCGNRRPKPPIRITWLHLFFNERDQTGIGKYSYQQIGVGSSTAHIIRGYRGLAWIEVEDGKISHWREYRL